VLHPPGVRARVCVVSPIAQIEYKCTDLYDPQGELGIAWNDPALAIRWPVRDPLLSVRDQHQPTLAEAGDRLPTFVGSVSATDL
jgi:dTDP-4-dehydrorhamnose 3,5-epimerase